MVVEGAVESLRDDQTWRRVVWWSGSEIMVGWSYWYIAYICIFTYLYLVTSDLAAGGWGNCVEGKRLCCLLSEIDVCVLLLDI